jgi:hypothetical protein
MPDLTTRLSAAWREGRDHLGLAAVPALVALLSFRKIEQVASFTGAHFGIAFGLPTPVPSVWTAVSLPTGTPTPGGTSFDLTLLAALPVAVVVRSVLTAGFLGSLREIAASGTYDFTANVRRYVVGFLLYDAVVTLLGTGSVLLIGGGTLAGGTAVLGIVAVVGLFGFVVLSYLFWATPFLLVTREADLLSAFRGSYALATAGGPYFAYSAGYLGVVVALSVPTTVVVVNPGLAGIVLGAVAFAPIALMLALATLRFVADVDAESVDLGSWEDSPDVGSGDASPSGADQ